MGGEGGRDGGFGLGEGESDIGLLEGTTVVGPVPAHRCLPAHLLVDHHDLGLVVGFGPREDSGLLDELPMHQGDVADSPREHLVKGPARHTQLRVGLLSLDGNIEHKLLVAVLDGLIQLHRPVPQGGPFALVVLPGQLAPEDIVLDVGFSDGFVHREVLAVVVVVEDEDLLRQLVVYEVDQDQVLALV